MRKIILIFTFFVLMSSTYSQQYNLYHLLVSELGHFYYKGVYDTCEVLLSEIEQNQFKPYPSHLKLLFLSSVKTSNKYRTNIYLEKYLNQTEVDSNYVIDIVNKSGVANWSFPNDVRKEYDSLKLYYYMNFDFQYSSKLLSLFELDQYCRIHSPDSLVSFAMDVDKNNYKQLINLIQTRGFPEYSKVGKNAFKALYLLLMHASTYSNNFQYIDSMLRVQMGKNNFEPWRYANIVDRYYRSNRKPQIYGSFIEHNSQGNIYGQIEDVENLDIKRFEIGLYPFYRFAKDVKINILPKMYVKHSMLNYYFQEK